MINKQKLKSGQSLTQSYPCIFCTHKKKPSQEMTDSKSIGLIVKDMIPSQVSCSLPLQELFVSLPLPVSFFLPQP